MNQPGQVKRPSSSNTNTRVLANVAIQVGCLTFVIIFAALIAGLLLDRVLHTNGLFTILLILASVPLTWVFIFWIVNRAKKQIIGSGSVSPQDSISQTEEDSSDKN
jgi:uncharacterized membrane protein YobD (UPF0266 family)